MAYPDPFCPHPFLVYAPVGEAFAFIQSLSSALRKLSPSQYGQKRSV